MKPTRRNPANAMLELIFEVLKREDETLNRLAMEVITANGKDAVHTLVIAALGSKNVKHQVRLLDIIAEIGEVSDPGDQLNLYTLTRDKSPEVRDAAVAAFYAVGPHGKRERARLEELAQAYNDPDFVAERDGRL